MAKDAKLMELENRSVGSLLMSYSLPAIVGMAAMSIYNIVDAIYVGQWCGAFAITAMTLVFPIMNLTVAVGALVGLGCATTASITLGQGRYGRAFRVLGHCVVMSLILGVVIGWLPLPWLREVLEVFGASGQTLQPAYDFMLVTMLGFPVSSMFMNLNHLMRASGYPKKAMVSLLISMLVNVAVAPVFIYVLDWGVKGAALATVAAQAVGLVWVLMHFAGRRHVLHFRRKIYGLSAPLVRRICLVGLPPFLVNVVGCVVVVVYNQLFLAYDGEMGVGAYGVVNRVLFFFFMVVLGIAQGLQPIAGYNLGLGNYGRVRRVLYYALGAAACVTAFGSLLVELFPREIVGIFVRETDAHSGVLIEIATPGIRLMSICFVLVGPQAIIGNFFQAIGRPIMSIFLNLTRQLIFLLPCLFLLPRMLGEPGIWLSQALSDLLAACLAFSVLYLFLKRVFHHTDVVFPPVS